MRIYIAHQITGLTPEIVYNYYKETGELLRQRGYEVLCPMTGKGYLRTAEEHVYKPKDYNFPPSTNHAIFERDKWMVTNCDVWYCDFTGMTRVGIGILFELAWAALLGKHTVSVIPEGNIHQHAFVLEASDIVFATEEEALNYLEKLALGTMD